MRQKRAGTLPARNSNVPARNSNVPLPTRVR